MVHLVIALYGNSLGDKLIVQKVYLCSLPGHQINVSQECPVEASLIIFFLQENHSVRRLERYIQHIFEILRKISIQERKKGKGEGGKENVSRIMLITPYI